MAVISPNSPYEASETALSYAARLSFVHTGMTIRRLLEDLDLGRDRFLTGKPEAIESFAADVGADPLQLSRGTVELLSRYGRFRGEDISTGFISTKVRKFCPQCLMEDGAREAWKHRLLWCFQHVDGCAVHGVRLAELAGSEKVCDLREVIEGRTALEALNTTEPFSAPDWQTWLSARLEGAADDPWLADHTIEQVVAASEMIGAVLGHGQQIRLRSLSRQERSDAVERGFSYYREGQGGVMAALDEIQARSSARAVQAGPLAVYGRLYDWLEGGAKLIDPGPIRPLLRDRILSHIPMAKGERLLGEEVTERRLHSVVSLGETLGIHRKRLTRLLAKLGLAPEGASDAETGLLTFPVGEVEELQKDVAHAIPYEEVANHLGASIRQVQMLYGAGMIMPLFPPAGAGSVRRLVFARRHLDAFLNQVSRADVLDGDVGDDFVSIAVACQRIGMMTPDLVDAVFTGRIQGWRDPSLSGLAALKVRLDDVRSLKAATEIRAA
ncbi:TniQ family protein [Paracoccus aminophilus]|nr:TniQ family protein [Paracoccus aminophilus]